jgi:phosphoribosyl 1,2-cyclic phosphodiesterase
VLEITFWGVRGSTPSPGPATCRYGGHTACVVVEAEGQRPLVLDLGTGVRAWGASTACSGRPVTAAVLLSHLHWDHIEGLPHFTPLDREGTLLEVYGPLPGGLSDAVRPPFFPVALGDRPGLVRTFDVEDEEIALGGAKVLVRTVPHPGRTNGYRVDWEGVRLAYVSDHQAPDGLDRVDEAVLELADGADLLIHDAQYTPEEFRARPGWGHSTVDYAVLVARESGARSLALFHHDPDRTDDDLERLLAGARRTADRLGVAEVWAAAEGRTLTLGA